MEFQKILDYREIAVSDLIGVLALSPSPMLLRRHVQGSHKYQDFFILWKEARSDIPILKGAKAEYDRL